MRVLVTGASGQLGAYVLDALAWRGHRAVAWSGSTMGEFGGVPIRPVPLHPYRILAPALDAADPDVILHLAALSSAAECHADPDRASRVNDEATQNLLSWCVGAYRRLVFTSTDMVFGGDSAPYFEADEPDPTTTYGRTKAAAEESVIASPGHLVARLSLLFGRSLGGRAGFFDSAMADLAAGRPRSFFEDEYRTPLPYAAAAEALVRLAERDVSGTVHIAGAERLSRFDLMRRAAAAMGLDASLVRANRQSDVPGPEPRPADVSLDTSRLAALLPDLARPTVEEAIRERSPSR